MGMLIPSPWSFEDSCVIDSRKKFARLRLHRCQNQWLLKVIKNNVIGGHRIDAHCTRRVLYPTKWRRIPMKHLRSSMRTDVSLSTFVMLRWRLTDQSSSRFVRNDWRILEVVLLILRGSVWNASSWLNHFFWIDKIEVPKQNRRKQTNHLNDAENSTQRSTTFSSQDQCIESKILSIDEAWMKKNQTPFSGRNS